MKLESKHLAPYLIYKIKLRYIDCITNRNRTAFLTGITTEGIETTYSRKIKGCSGDFICFTGNNNISLLKLKPILRPLSDLKTIEKEIKLVDSYWYVDDYLTEKCTVDKIYPLHVIEFIPYAIMQVLLKYHFDVFGLIEKGLAIDINTI